MVLIHLFSVTRRVNLICGDGSADSAECFVLVIGGLRDFRSLLLFVDFVMPFYEKPS